ncbi:hypothetical protein CCR95_14295 [Thiocystis minor]|uniref:HGGxSTG domain-containing protein n=1 Tax=Thiocystis minor TaxID=61597 RepID=UPI001911910E|nr:HGGxSTG domain-containing protein [Thiocystis minor]MBK5965226.1 hypothetical protein [Thiocystis minor]
MTDLSSHPRPSRKRKGAPVCGAKTRRGTPCQCKPLKRGGRCRFHGGLSTGPRTPEGRIQATENLAKARAALNSPEHVDTRKTRAAKGRKTLERRARYRKMGLPEWLW